MLVVAAAGVVALQGWWLTAPMADASVLVTLATTFLVSLLTAGTMGVALHMMVKLIASAHPRVPKAESSP